VPGTRRQNFAVTNACRETEKIAEDGMMCRSENSTKEAEEFIDEKYGRTEKTNPRSS